MDPLLLELPSPIPLPCPPHPFRSSQSPELSFL